MLHLKKRNLCYQFLSLVSLSDDNICFSSVAQSCLILYDPMDHSMPGFPIHHQLLELAQTHVHWVDDTSQPSCPLCLFLLLPSIFPSIRVFANESALLIRWPKYWSFSINPSNKYSSLISFRINLFDLFAVQGTPKSLLHHHNSKASNFLGSAFFMVQPLTSMHDYWKDPSFDYLDFCQPNDISAFSRSVGDR